EVIGAEPLEARRTGSCDAVARDVVRPHLGDQEYAIALSGNDVADQFLGAVDFGSIDQGHAEIDAGAHRGFLLGLRMPAMREPRRALSKRRHAACEVSRCAQRLTARWRIERKPGSLP